MQDFDLAFEGAVKGSASAAQFLLHDHGQWIGINRWSAKLARLHCVPRIVSPRGMLSPWSLSHRRFKKFFAWKAYAKSDITQAAIIHATSELELSELRALGLKNPIAMIPNGVSKLPEPDPDTSTLDRPYFLFLSRIHVKKGILELIDLWRQSAPQGWNLVIAGPDEQGLMTKSVMPPNCRYIGAVSGAVKSRWLHDASVFILPTHSENFGIVIAEALMAGTPVITTHGAPWSGLQLHHCGWWVPMDKQSLRDAIAEAAGCSSSELSAMGQLGKRWVTAEFDWNQIGMKMSSLYQWVIDRDSDEPSWLDR